MSIHENLPPKAKKDLQEVGWTKALELAKVARRYGEEFDCATWLHKAREISISFRWPKFIQRLVGKQPKSRTK
jgi:hypothetical protein